MFVFDSLCAWAYVASLAPAIKCSECIQTAQNY